LRLFIAINLHESIRDRIDRLVGSLRSLDLPVRWVDSSTFHLTLAFLGEVSADRVSAIEESMALAASEQHAFAIRLGQLAVAPSLRRPRVIWLEVERSRVLEELQSRLAGSLDERGFVLEARGFRPHVTLGRARRQARPADFARLPGVASKLDFETVVPVPSVDLMRSDLSDKPARYRVVSRCALREAV
jgi:2'-5' RNA ligase